MTTMAEPVTTSAAAPTVAWTSLTQGVNILCVGQSRELWRVYHDTYCIAVVQGGSGRWKYRGRHHEIRPSTLMISEPGEVHTTTAVESPGSFTSIFIDPRFIESQLGSNLRGALHFKMAQTTTSSLWRQLARQLRDVTHHYAATEVTGVVTEYLLLALHELFRTAAEREPLTAPMCQSRLTRVRDAIIDNYKTSPGDRLNIGQLAQELGVSRYWLTHSFKRQFGYAPNELHTLLRVAKVKQLVTAGGKNLASISREAGYCDQSQMTREFKTHWRVTPGQLQQLVDSSL